MNFIQFRASMLRSIPRRSLIFLFPDRNAVFQTHQFQYLQASIASLRCSAETPTITAMSPLQAGQSDAQSQFFSAAISNTFRLLFLQTFFQPSKHDIHKKMAYRFPFIRSPDSP